MRESYKSGIIGMTGESLADAVDREVREKVVKKIANELEAEEKQDKITSANWQT